MRSLRAVCILVGLGVLTASPAFAQGAITGIVRDASGEVLPGVTVEAGSPGSSSASAPTVSDSDGQYRIVDLRAGTYTVTFTLPGFSTVKREGIELSGTFVAAINADLTVGAVEETVTVTGETPIVDVQSVRRQTTIDNELINAIPAARSYAGLMTLMPDTVTQGGCGIEHAGRAGHGGVRRRRRPRQRRPAAARRPERRHRRSTAPACRPTLPT